MGNVVAKIKDWVVTEGQGGGGGGYAEQELADRQAESHRMANDPNALADVALRAVRRHDALTIQDLEEALDAERREFNALEQTVRDVVNLFQQECAPLVHSLHAHTANMAALRDMLVKRRTEP